MLVVDDGSSTDLRPIFEEMPANVTLLRGDADASFRAGQARQFGADRARFEYLAFLDADVAVGEDYLWHLDWVHRQAGEAVVLGYLSGYNLHDLEPLTGRTDSHTLDNVAPLGAPQDAQRVILDRQREPPLRRCLDNLDWLQDPWRLCYTGNLSVPKACLLYSTDAPDYLTRRSHAVRLPA